MKRSFAICLVGFLSSICAVTFAQQFRISDYGGTNVTIEYPPSFDGAFLFIEHRTNLVSDMWEPVDYSQITLVEGQEILYSPATDPNSGSSTNAVEVPYEISPEYITALANGEITNSEWTASSSAPLPLEEGDAEFYRMEAISYVDTDGDGVDNVTEYGAGTNPFVIDNPTIPLPPDDGDPRPVPGSVNSAPGDWNTPPQSDYHAFVGLHGAVNARILAATGSSGSFTAASTYDAMGAWIAAHCTLFYRPEDEGFSWEGKEEILSLTFSYSNDPGYVNHLVKIDEGDPSGLAVLADGTPVIVNSSNPWTKDKLEACLSNLVTVSCRFQYA